MNASKLLSKTSSDRRKRVITGQQGPTENNTVNNERNLVPSVFIRIVAAKCLSRSKQNSSNLSSFLNSLKRVNPTFSKDPVAYREKYVYTKTSKVLRLFGTRFYAKILKNKKTDSNFNPKKSNFGLNKTTDKRTLRKNVSNNEKSFASSQGFKMTRPNSSVSVNLENKSKSVNVLPFALKSATSQTTVNQNFSNKASFSFKRDSRASCCCLIRNIERTRARNSTGLTGLLIKSSAPVFKARAKSSLLLRAVTITIGI